MPLISFIVIGLLVYNFGFDVSYSTTHKVRIVLNMLLIIFFISYILRIFLGYDDAKFHKSKWFELILFTFLFIAVFLRFVIQPYFGSHISLGILNSNILLYALLLILSLVEISKWSFYLLDRTFNPSLLIVFSFLFIILIGAFLLKLPNATVKSISFLDALFTSTSAVCVTGLIVVDTATAFTPLGKLIIILLIQIGGIGIMTFTTFFALFLRNQSTFHRHIVIRELISGDSLNGIFKTLVNIVLVTFSIEAIGAGIIYLTIHGKIGTNEWNEVAFSAFHSISAFCNAGFSLLSGSLDDKLVRTNYWLHTTIAVIIIFGGIGFPIVFNYWKYIKYTIKNRIRLLLGKQKAYVHSRIISVNTRLALTTTLILILSGTALFLFLEYNNTLSGLPFIEKLSVAFFNSVTPRTAGFNNIDITACLQSTLFVVILLMWIGASPMSTGGGIKTTTFALMALNIVGIIRGKKTVEVAHREVYPESLSRAQAALALSLIWLAISIFLLTVFEPQASLLTIIYECVSALSTVGLSLNFTSTLSIPSKIVIIITMFVGRVGLITILIGIVNKFVPKNYNYPSESVMV